MGITRRTGEIQVPSCTATPSISLTFTAPARTHRRAKNSEAHEEVLLIKAVFEIPLGNPQLIILSHLQRTQTFTNTKRHGITVLEVIICSSTVSY
eukprot:6475549-Amphidinium_carterae.1